MMKKGREAVAQYILCNPFSLDKMTYKKGLLQRSGAGLHRVTGEQSFRAASSFVSIVNHQL
jgi:hypothetical protein